MSLLDKASLVQIPSGYREGKLYSAKPTPTFGNELAINGDFTTDSDWTKGGGWSIVNGEAVHTGSGDYIEQGSLVQGTKYRVVIVVTQASGSGFTQIYMGGLTTAMTSPNTYTFDITAQSGDKIKLRGLNDCKVDSISVKEILVEDGDFDFSRSSTGTRVNSDGYIEEVPWNLITYSEDYSSGSWVKSNTTTIANDTISPRGTQDATKIHPNSSGNYRHIRNNLFNPSSGLVTFSIYAKANELDHLVLIDYDGGGIGIDFDLTNGVATDNASTPFDSFSMTDVGDGWYRCEATATDMYFYWILSDNGGLSVTANGADGLYIWGAMINKGTSVKPYIKTTDRLDIPRLDYTNSTTPTLLLEGQRTNLVTYSEQLDNAWWQKVNVTINSNNIVSPDGTQNADALVDDTTYGVHRVNTSNINIVSGNSYSFSGFVKSGSVDFLHISPSSGQFSSDNTTVINMSNGTLVSKEHTGPVSIIDFGNGWYRFEITLTAISSSLYSKQYYNPSSSSTSPIYTGTNDISCYMWGLQVEQGSYPTCYIPTSGTSVTRVADVCEGAGDATIFNDSEGVLFTEIAALADDETSRAITIDGAGSNENRIIIQYQPSFSNQIRAFLSNSDNTNIQLTYVLSDITQYAKIAFKYKSGDLALWVNGVERVTSSDVLFLSNLNELSFDNGRGESKFFGKCKQLIYFNEALTDEELTTLTTI